MIRRGAVHTLDAFLAASIIAMALLYAAQTPRERDYIGEETLKAEGMQALMRLNSNGTLGLLVEARSWGELEQVLRIALPGGVSFNLTVLDEFGLHLNNVTISNGGLIGRTVESLEYLLAVESGVCPLYRIRLQLGG
ncbi:MAG: hypothetical protein OEW93_07265 [Candidatus Bathyarchaeota archaeon]|nr:hypothetical protein [Candidatus Bathyarchaeota archaeon]